MKTKIIFLFLFSIKLFAGIGIGYSTSGALPVELTLFTATHNESGVLLYWRTETEVNNYGFEIERLASSSNTPGQEGFTKIEFVPGHGNSNSPKEYSFTDENSPSGKVQYRLKQIDTDGQFEYSKIVTIIGVSDEINHKFALEQNYPNPFNPSTVISYYIPEAGIVTLKVFDVLGREVAILIKEFKDAGIHNSTFSILNSKFSSGIYFYTFRSGNFFSIKKMMLLK